MIFIPRLRQTKLLTISPVGDLLHNLIVKTFKLLVQNSLEGPGLVPALVHGAPEADLLEVVGAVPLCQVVTSALSVAVQGETSLAIVVNREGGTVGAFKCPISEHFNYFPFLHLCPDTMKHTPLLFPACWKITPEQSHGQSSGSGQLSSQM